MDARLAVAKESLFWKAPMFARALARVVTAASMDVRASCAPAAVRMIKRSIYRNMQWDPKNAAEIEAHCQSRSLETEDANEGIRALLEKREPCFQGR